MDFNLVCKECGQTFLFSEGEQKYYLQNGLMPPKRCKFCRNNNFTSELGIKTSSYFENANIYGPGTSVSGGLSIEHSYYVKVNDKYVVVKDGRIIFTETKTECTFFNCRQDAMKCVEMMTEGNKGNSKIMAQSCYQTIRG